MNRLSTLPRSFNAATSSSHNNPRNNQQPVQSKAVYSIQVIFNSIEKLRTQEKKMN